MGADLSTPSSPVSGQTEAEQTQATQSPAVVESPIETAKTIFERYVEPQGTKVEVDPTEVLDTDDVVKKKNKETKEKKATQ